MNKSKISDDTLNKVLDHYGYDNDMLKDKLFYCSTVFERKGLMVMPAVLIPGHYKQRTIIEYDPTYEYYLVITQNGYD